MNGAVYISFFQGQLESVLEQVVQLAVQEISKTVGASLNSMLMETAAKEQENHRLSLKLQSRECERKGVENGSNCGKSDSAATDRTKQEPNAHTPSLTTERGVSADTRRLEQKGRVVGQLKTVMEQVLEFAVCELTKIVEASFDDLLLEITGKEREQADLEERLRRDERPENGKSRAGRRRCSEHGSTSPSGSEGTRDEAGGGDVTAAKISRRNESADVRNDSGKPASVLSVAQDWVPILDKVFGQKWCSDLWQIKELPSMGRDPEGLGLGSGSAGLLRTEDLQPSPTSPQQDPRWMPLEDMEVLSLTPDPQPATPTQSVEDCPLRSPSMLHRLLTLPAQLLEDDEDADAMDPPSLGPPEASPHRGRDMHISTAASPKHGGPQPPRKQERAEVEEDEEEEEEEDEEEEEEEEKGTKARNVKGRKSHECHECGRKFSRARLLRAHQQQTHSATSATPASAELRCSECGKRFSQAARLQAHVRTHAGKKN